MKKNKILITLILILALAITSIALAYFTKLGYLESFRIIFGSIYVLFLPGFILSYAFFLKTKSIDEKNNDNSIDWLERIALSFALSIAIVPLIIFYLNLIGMKINLLNSFLTILGIIITSLIIIFIRIRKLKNYSTHSS